MEVEEEEEEVEVSEMEVGGRWRSRRRRRMGGHPLIPFLPHSHSHISLLSLFNSPKSLYFSSLLTLSLSSTSSLCPCLSSFSSHPLPFSLAPSPSIFASLSIFLPRSLPPSSSPSPSSSPCHSFFSSPFSLSVSLTTSFYHYT